jgi:hypothetical protein
MGRVVTASLLVACIIPLWLIATGFLVVTIPISLAFALPGLVALGICLRSSRRNEWGRVAAWAAWSLAPLSFLAVLALAPIHLHEFIGWGAACDAIAQDCSPQPLQGLAHTAPLDAFAAAAAGTVWLIALARRRDRLASRLPQ